jgi:hypothetical protein
MQSRDRPLLCKTPELRRRRTERALRQPINRSCSICQQSAVPPAAWVDRVGPHEETAELAWDPKPPTAVVGLCPPLACGRGGRPYHGGAVRIVMQPRALAKASFPHPSLFGGTEQSPTNPPEWYAFGNVEAPIVRILQARIAWAVGRLRSI